MALKDISGASNSKVSSQNAFVYGLGVRLNKYFRISAGGMLYGPRCPLWAVSPARPTARCVMNCSSALYRRDGPIGAAIDFRESEVELIE